MDATNSPIPPPSNLDTSEYEDPEVAVAAVKMALEDPNVGHMIRQIAGGADLKHRDSAVSNTFRVEADAFYKEKIDENWPSIRNGVLTIVQGAQFHSSVLSMFYWNSVREMSIAVFCFLLYLSWAAVPVYNLIYCNILHIVRPFVGFIIVVYMPRLDVIVEEVSDIVRKNEKGYYQDAFKGYMSRFKGLFFLVIIYLIITVTALFLDLLAFFIALGYMGTERNNSNNGEIGSLVVVYFWSVVYICLDVNIFFMLPTLKFGAPIFAWRALLHAFKLAFNFVKEKSTDIKKSIDEKRAAAAAAEAGSGNRDVPTASMDASGNIQVPSGYGQYDSQPAFNSNSVHVNTTYGSYGGSATRL